jgi:hypothetical protein
VKVMFGSDRVATTSPPNTKLGLGCVALFLLPFAGAGAFAGWQGLQRAAQGNWREALYFALFAVVFGGVGFGGLALVLLGKRKLEEQESLKTKHPDEPWLWQKDWAAGRVEDASRLGAWGAWAFALLWNLVSLPAGYAGVRAALYENNKAGMIALLFPLVGLGLAVWAVRATVRLKKYGSSRFELSTLPGVIGHTIAGTVRVPSQLNPAEGFYIVLSCVRRITTRGKDSSTTDSILWQEERYIRAEQSRDAGGMNTRIPIAFRLPADAKPCDSTDPNDRILWRLQVSAEVPGVDYASLFEVPVFRTAASDRPLSEAEDRLTHDQLVPDNYRQPADSRIKVTANLRGVEIYFAAARNLGAATGGTVFTAIWVAVVWFLIQFKAPLLFPIVFGLFGLLLIYGTLQLWLGVSRVTVNASSIAIASGYLSPGGERSLNAGDVADISTTIGMQAGTTPYYDLVIVLKNGKKVIAGRSVRDKREAEWLAITLRKALGLTPSQTRTSARNVA